MKSNIVFVFSLLSITVFSQGRTFTVEKLSKPETFLSTKSNKDIFEGLILSDIYVNHNDINMDEFPFGIVAKSKLPDELVSFGYHSFFNGMYQAYADHRPFVLSPDMIWLLISQGFARHVNANPESLRHHFVDFAGKITLVVATNEITLDNPDSPWEKIFPEFTKQIAGHTGNEIIHLLSSDFSTTTSVEKVASEITILEAMKTYFEYVVMRIVCGIPEITLQGTTEDWQKILDKTKQLAKYDLAWWTSELEPVLQEFVKASKGKIDTKFWQGMFKYHSKKIPCGGPVTTIDGWMVKFFPYDNKGNRNNLKTLYSSENLPEEIVKVDLKYIDSATGITPPLELWAGFIGLEQNTKNYALTPKIGWMIRKKDVKQVGLQQQYEYDLKMTGEIAIRVKEIPEAVFSLQEIKKLSIQFTDSIVIPDRLTKVKIKKLDLSGRITQQEKERIRQLFPNTDVYIEAKGSVNSIKTVTANAQQAHVIERNDDPDLYDLTNYSALVIIDGKEGGDLNSLSIDSIATFQVLKDQAAIEKYGEKGKNGVVIVTTKSHQSKTPLFVIGGNTGNNPDQIIGVWKFVSSPSMMARIEIVKIITKGYFVCMHITNNGIVTSFGGPCTFDGETYIENIMFGTQNRNDIGRTGTFKIKFEDKKMYLSGLVSGPDRVPFSEVWERVE